MKSLLLPSIFLVASIANLRAQAVEGTVALPKPEPDLGVSQRYQTDLPVAPTNPPAAVVYLEGTFSAVPPPATHAQMAQKNISFFPDLVPVLVGATVDFPNLDDTYHNVFSYSKSKRFDLGRYRKDEKAGSVRFDKAGCITIHCDVHERMRGVILVLESPYFSKTDNQGHYRLDHLPIGHYTLKAWITERETRERPVDLKKGDLLHVDFPAR